MFKKGKKRELETGYDKRRSMMMNRLMCIVVGGVLLYSFVQAFLEEEPMPVWFIVAMIALLAGVALVLVWNVRMVKEFDQKQLELEKLEQEQKFLQERAGAEEIVLENIDEEELD